MTTPEQVVAEGFEAVVVRPADTLIVRIDPRSTMEQAHRVLSQLKADLPDVAGVVLVAAEQILVYRPDGEP
jgi:hypothetical protein